MLAPLRQRLPGLARDRAQERAVQTRLILARERALEQHLARTIAAAGRRAAQAVRHGERPEGELRSLADELSRVLGPSIAETARTFGGRVIAGPKSAHGFLGLESKAFSDLDEAIRRHTETDTARRVVNISDSLRETIRRIVAEAMGEGIESVGQEELARRIVEATSGEIAMQRARRIARTEIHNAAMLGQQAAADASPLAFEKVWLATEDVRTRASHAAANGQRVALEERFVLQPEDGPPVLLRYPGDTQGPPGETINCRCVCLYEPLPRLKEPPPETDVADGETVAEPVEQVEAVDRPLDVELPPEPDAEPLPQPVPAAEEPLPVRDLEAVPYEREASVVYAAGTGLLLRPEGTPRTGATVQIVGPSRFYDSPDAPEVDRDIAANPAFLGFRRPVLWQVTIPAGAEYPRNLVEDAGAGVIVNSGVGRYGLVVLHVDAVRKMRWGEAAPKDFIDPGKFDPLVLQQLQDVIGALGGVHPVWGTQNDPTDALRPRDMGTMLARTMVGLRRLGAETDIDWEDRVPDSVIRTLADTPWTRASLLAWLERLLAGDVQDEPGPGEPETDARVIVVEATLDIGAAIPKEGA